MSANMATKAIARDKSSTDRVSLMMRNENYPGLFWKLVNLNAFPPADWGP